MKSSSRIGLLLVLLLTACNPAALPSTPAEFSSIGVGLPATPADEPTPAPTSAPVEEQVYPYYLLLATKPDVPAQTINDVTVEIDWAYADESRVALQYTISGLDWPKGQPWDASYAQLSSPTVEESAIGWGGGGWSGTPVEDGSITATTDQLFVDGALDAEKHPILRLQVAIPVQGPSDVGTFHFEFDVPVLDGIKIEDINQTVTANDVSMTLKTLVLTPSRATALICFQMPSSVDWGLTASTVTLGGKEYPFMGGGALQGVDGKGFLLTGPERCSAVGFDVSYDRSATSLTLTVPQLVASIPEVIDQERVATANQRLEGTGIEFDYENVDHGGNIVILKRPDGATDMEIYPKIWEAMADRYEGPWAFEVPLER